MGPQGLKVRGFTGTRGKGRYITTPGVQILQCKVAQTPDTDYPDAIDGTHTKLHERTENRYSAAKKRSARGSGQGPRHGDGPCKVATHALGKTPMAAHDGRLRRGTQVIIAGQALRTVHATAREPSKTHAISFVESTHLAPARHDPADHLVARYQRIHGYTPRVFPHRQVRMAEPTIFHADLHLVGLERTRIIGKALKGLARPGCSPRLD